MCEGHRFWTTMSILLVGLISSRGVTAIVCHKCDSLTLESCAMSLDETGLPYEECKTSLQCAMSIVNSITYRGCGSNTPTIGATYKKSCSDNLCNKGVYPPGRLKCHHCQGGTSCAAKTVGKPRPCLHHHETDQCYTEAQDADTVYRGCRSDTNHTVSRDDAEFCDINGCNDRAAVTTLTCVQCDSEQSPGCKMDLFEVNAGVCNISQYETCEVRSLNSGRETCFLYHQLSRVVRGCSRNFPPQLNQQRTEFTKECSDVDFCNARCLKQQKCLVCDSESNELCRSNTTPLAANICGSAEVSSCHACEYATGTVRRGCGSPPTQTEETAVRCFECDEVDRCNAALFTRCYKCSSDSDVNCASWDRPGFGIEIEKCAKPGAACLVAAFVDGRTVRGCESEQLYCNATTELASCRSCKDSSFCNRGAFPANRLRCYQCSGADDCAFVEQRDPLPCALSQLEPVAKMDACTEFHDPETGIVHRGCRSNTTQYYQCMLQARGGCRICYEDGCNRNLIEVIY